MAAVWYQYQAHQSILGLDCYSFDWDFADQKIVLCIFLLPSDSGSCQQLKKRKDIGDNRIRPGGKRVKLRYPKVKEVAVKGQSLLTQVLDKGRFTRLGQTTTMTPGKPIELRCKGSSIGWSYPTYLDTFNDSRLRCWQITSAVLLRRLESERLTCLCPPPAALNTATNTVSWSWRRPLLLTRVPTAAGSYCVTERSVKEIQTGRMCHTSISQVINNQDSFLEKISCCNGESLGVVNTKNTTFLMCGLAC